MKLVIMMPMMTLKASTSECHLRAGTELQKRIGYTGGWCPTGEVKGHQQICLVIRFCQVRHFTQMLASSDPLCLSNVQLGKRIALRLRNPIKCSDLIRSGKFCQFPVKVGGEVHWDCIDHNGVPLCNTR